MIKSNRAFRFWCHIKLRMESRAPCSKSADGTGDGSQCNPCMGGGAFAIASTTIISCGTDAPTATSAWLAVRMPSSARATMLGLTTSQHPCWTPRAMTLVEQHRAILCLRGCHAQGDCMIQRCPCHPHWQLCGQSKLSSVQSEPTRSSEGLQ